MIAASQIYREVPFSLSLLASEVYPSWNQSTEENVLIQGVIDCIIPAEDGWIILDYKTDTIHEELSDELRERLVKRYETQMNLYTRAIEKIWQEPVKKTYLYFFAKHLLIDIST